MLGRESRVVRSVTVEVPSVARSRGARVVSIEAVAPQGAAKIRVTRSVNDEVWVQVTGDDGTPDLPTIREQLPPDVAGLPLKRYLPGSAVTGEWACEDWWILDAGQGADA